MRGPETYSEKFTEGLYEGSIHESSKLEEMKEFKRGCILSPTTERTNSYLLTDKGAWQKRHDVIKYSRNAGQELF